jgi:hypothetical protein
MIFMLLRVMPNLIPLMASKNSLWSNWPLLQIHGIHTYVQVKWMGDHDGATAVYSVHRNFVHQRYYLLLFSTPEIETPANPSLVFVRLFKRLFDQHLQIGLFHARHHDICRLRGVRLMRGVDIQVRVELVR